MDNGGHKSLHSTANQAVFAAFPGSAGRDRNNLDMPQEIMRVLCESIRIFAGEWTVFEVL